MNLDTYLQTAYNEFHNKYEKGKDYEYYAPGEKPKEENFKPHDCIKEDYDGVIYKGYYSTPFAMSVQAKYDINQLTKLWQKHKFDLSQLDNEGAQKMKDLQWAKLNGEFKFETFQEDTEIIHEGMIIRCAYFEDNSLRTRQIIDHESGEIVYETRFVKGQYYDEDTDREYSYLKSFERYSNGKTIKAEKVKTDKGLTRWKITFPASYAGRYMEDLYANRFIFKKYGSSRLQRKRSKGSAQIVSKV